MPDDANPLSAAADLAARKRSARARARARRAGLAAADEAGQPARTDHVLALPEVARAQVVCAYLAVRSEPATDLLVGRLHERGARVLLPVVRADLDLDWAVDDGTRAPGAGPGVPEPGGERLGTGAVAGADVVVVPALAVDRHGQRLGQGGGSYDRALARARPDALVVALLHDGELSEDDLPVQPHDRPVDVLVTASGVLRFDHPVSPRG